MYRIVLLLVLMLSVATACVGVGQNPRNTAQPETDLAAMGMNPNTEQLGTFSTSFKPGDDEGRDVNIKLASDSINQSVVQPGEEFSFNKAVGPTTEKNGYQLSMIYVSGKKDEGYGGGVCQVSSTLYNAAANAGMTITERHDHSLPVTYVEAGKEAATSYGVKDFKFVNELSYPVVIHSHVADGKINVSILTV